MFCYLGMFGQAFLWPSLRDRATKKKENCHSLSIVLNLKLKFWGMMRNIILIMGFHLTPKKYYFQLSPGGGGCSENILTRGGGGTHTGKGYVDVPRS